MTKEEVFGESRGADADGDGQFNFEEFEVKLRSGQLDEDEVDLAGFVEVLSGSSRIVRR